MKRRRDGERELGRENPPFTYWDYEQSKREIQEREQGGSYEDEVKKLAAWLGL